MQEIYSIPPYDSTTAFLITIALTRGRLGKGGVPDLEAAAVTILRDWNAGKIPFFTRPPAVHPSAYDKEKDRSTAQVTGEGEGDGMSVDDGGNNGGDAILKGMSEAFDLDGLLALTNGAEFDGEVEDEENATEATGLPMSMPIDEE